MSKRKGYGYFERNRKALTAAVAVTGVLFATLTYDRFAQTPVMDEALSIGGVTLVVLGILGRLWATVHIGGHKNQELVTTGPYALCRNPLYFFSFVAGIGVCMAFENFALIAFILAAFALYYPRVIRGEEKRLEELFGDEFCAYRKSTPAFFPRLWMLSFRDTPPLMPAHILKTLRDSSVFIILVVLAEILEMLQEQGLLKVLYLP